MYFVYGAKIKKGNQKQTLLSKQKRRTRRGWHARHHRIYSIGPRVQA